MRQKSSVLQNEFVLKKMVKIVWLTQKKDVPKIQKIDMSLSLQGKFKKISRIIETPITCTMIYLKQIGSISPRQQIIYRKKKEKVIGIQILANFLFKRLLSQNSQFLKKKLIKILVVTDKITPKLPKIFQIYGLFPQFPQSLYYLRNAFQLHESIPNPTSVKGVKKIQQQSVKKTISNQFIVINDFLFCMYHDLWWFFIQLKIITYKVQEYTINCKTRKKKIVKLSLPLISSKNVPVEISFKCATIVIF
ncbi:hypothetical protein TTHERM_00365430 (macronuclear) [Tetrahymena thermophila SB210]|uniref:Uncharacterized protein n=1 Tax=Tetrahymena thermophila (strain SB210) TaxID=312017 RepID=Q22P98_TETTS|nr:hypothetical protein TTHERM_00365430 [Tetrahymena thermophila SB210]EAR87211.2 hypothetical protein TTHERM_00365430 [Tetrahymena thermophila SB210]|eukprot:XP_001007456.2 hypothetical protein TTHERM_00365430 [Tetrahymena thermophila SB210]